MTKTRELVEQLSATQVQLSGGVAANGYLRQIVLRAAGEEDRFQVFVPPTAPLHRTTRR